MWCTNIISTDAKLVLANCTPLSECIERGVCSCKVFIALFCVQKWLLYIYSKFRESVGLNINVWLLSLRAGHLWVTFASDENQSLATGRILLKRCQESEPALISVIFSILLHLSKLQYHWLKSRKREKTVNLLYLTKYSIKNKSSTFGVSRRIECTYYWCFNKFQPISG